MKMKIFQRKIFINLNFEFCILNFEFILWGPQRKFLKTNFLSVSAPGIEGAAGNWRLVNNPVKFFQLFLGGAFFGEIPADVAFRGVEFRPAPGPALEKGDVVGHFSYRFVAERFFLRHRFLLLDFFQGS